MNATTEQIILYASEKLRGAGFTLFYTSRKTEACYYSFPGGEGLIRIAAHKYSARGNGHDTPVYSCLTFGDKSTWKHWEAVDTHIERAIGRFILRRAIGNAIK